MLDPLTCLIYAEYAIDDRDTALAKRLLEKYKKWLDNGGHPPFPVVSLYGSDRTDKTGDEFHHMLTERLTGTPSCQTSQ